MLRHIVIKGGEIMYKNLEAELTRKGITKLALARKLNMRYPTLVDKLNGKYRLYFDEALRIREVVCPNADLDFLFNVDTKEQSEMNVFS